RRRLPARPLLLLGLGQALQGTRGRLPGSRLLDRPGRVWPRVHDRSVAGRPGQAVRKATPTPYVMTATTLPTRVISSPDRTAFLPVKKLRADPIRKRQATQMTAVMKRASSALGPEMARAKR